MPDTLSLSAGVSFGLVAGIVSGVCYLFVNGYTKPRNESRDTFDEKCISKEKRICVTCGGDDYGGFVPCICQRDRPAQLESGVWFLKQVQRALSLMPWSYSTERLEQIEEEHEESDSSDALVDLRNVRDFLEAISARLAGGTLEGTRVAPLYRHQAYVSMFERHHATLRDALAELSTALRDALKHLPQRLGIGTPAPTSNANSAHSQLKRIVARVVEEAAALPALARYAAEPHTPTEQSTYEDLLAAAILNKVIERYQTENGSGGRSSGIHSASASPSPSDSSSPRSLNVGNLRNLRDATSPLHEPGDVLEWEDGGDGEDVIELPRRVPFPEFGGDNEYRDFDEVSGSDIQAVDGSWEENWLFQKKKINTAQSVPVPMLVPNSNTEYKALIGDRDADDTTDLSDNASDDEDGIEYKSDIKRVLDSRHVIGGKPKLEHVPEFEPDSLMTVHGDHEELLDSIEHGVIVEDTSTPNKSNNVEADTDGRQDSMLIVDVNSGPIRKAEFNLKEEIYRTIVNGVYGHEFGEDNDTSEPCSLGTDVKCSESSFTYTSTPALHTTSHEREREYEETVTVPVQRYADSLRRKHFETAADVDGPSGDLAGDLIPGSIAYRERQKWMNYVEMPNNPYSPEAINRRLAAKSTSSLFDIVSTQKDFNRERPPSCDTLLNTDDGTEPDSLDVLDEQRTDLTAGAGCGDSGGRSGGKCEETPHYKRYGRDYYVKEARTSSGGRKYISYSDTSSISSSVNKSTSLDNFDVELASPELLIKQFNTIASNQEYSKFAANNNEMSITTIPIEYNNEILVEYEDADERSLFAAKPAFIAEDTDGQFEEILRSAYVLDKSHVAAIIDSVIDEAQRALANYEHTSSYSSSSLEDNIKIYNVQTGEIVKCKPDDNVSSRYGRNDAPVSDTSDKTILAENVDKVDRKWSSNGQDATILTELEESEKLEHINELDDTPTPLPNVKELAKKFTSMENVNEALKTSPITRKPKSRENIVDAGRPGSKLTYMHSLTARSISKEFRDELKLSMATPLTAPGGSRDVPDGCGDVTKESSAAATQLPGPGTLRTKLAFFESLKSKFSNK